MLISDAMETGTVQINSAPARGPDHFPFQVNNRFLITFCLGYDRLANSIVDWHKQGLKDSGIGSQGVTNSISLMTKVKTTVINLPTPSYSMG